jgi:hypothetical protein
LAVQQCSTSTTFYSQEKLNSFYKCHQQMIFYPFIQRDYSIIHSFHQLHSISLFFLLIVAIIRVAHFAIGIRVARLFGANMVKFLAP